MQAIALTHIPIRIDPLNLMKSLRVREGTQDALDLARMIDCGLKIANAKAFYGPAAIEAREEERVRVGGVWFTSRVLARNLEETEQVFPFVVTCGMELETWSEDFEDALERYWAEAIKEAVLRSAMGAFYAHLENTFRPGHVSTMSPGSLENWPISEQMPLFQLLGDTDEKIGVRLTDSLLMRPTKSVSGMVFERGESFTSCELCPRMDCPNRRAPYDETLYERVYCPRTA